jgi:hypothetical protein
MKYLLLLLTLAFASCGTTVCYTEPTTGIRVCEKIDGELNGTIDIPASGLPLKYGDLEVIPAK